jgi:hypothetical protein
MFDAHTPSQVINNSNYYYGIGQITHACAVVFLTEAEVKVSKW